jgi:PAS domain S-box-containing protein
MHIEQSLQKRVSSHFENEFVFPDGSTGWFDFSIKPVPEGVLILSIDNTERKRQEGKLFESEFRFSNLYENGPFGMVMANKDFRFKSVNPAFCNFLGYREEELKELTFKDVTYPDDVENDMINIQKIYDREISVYKTEKRYVHKDGQVKWGSLTVTATYDNEGQFLYKLGIIEDISSRKQADEELRKSMQLQSETELIGKVGGWEFNIDTKEQTWTEEVYRIHEVDFNFNPNVDKGIDFYSPESRPIVEEAVKRVIESGEPFDLELEIITAKGNLKKVHAMGKADFENRRIYGFFQDITERKLAEESLKNSESEFRLLAEAMPQIVWITRADGWNTYFNQQWVDYTGLTLEESYGHGWNKPFHPDDQQRAWDAWSNAVNNNGIYSIESRLRRADGVYQWWLVRGVPVLDADGNILKWFGTCTNINDMKMAEEAIRIHSGRLQNLHEIDQAILLAIESPEAVVQTALQFMRNLLQCQRASVGIFDLENKEVQVFAAGVDGKTILKIGTVLTEEVNGIIDILRQTNMEIVENLSILKLPSSINKVLQAEGIQSFLNVALVSEMEMYGVLNVGWENPRIFSSEEIEIVKEVAIQITIAIEKARLLKETKRYATELEDRVRDRTLLLESANKELEAFSYSVSHDLRAPLRHINGYVDLLNERFRENLPEKALHYLSIITDAAKEMGTLIDDLLQFSRSSRQEVHKEKLDMNALVKDVLEKTESDLRERDIIWSIQELPEVYGDYSLLKQVWVNLMDNAVKYTRLKQPAEIAIECREEKEAFVFCIRDNGVGFDMKYAHKLFGVFQRLHSQSEFEGTGIGLANVQRIIHKHNGRIWAEAEPNNGATFFFTIPKNQEDKQ